MTHQVIAFKRLLRPEIDTTSTPLSSATDKNAGSPSRQTVALSIALQYLANRDRASRPPISGLWLRSEPT